MLCFPQRVIMMREIVHHGFQLDRRQGACTQAAGWCTVSEGLEFGKVYT